MNCPRCGRENPPDRTECRLCGTALDTAGATGVTELGTRTHREAEAAIGIASEAEDPTQLSPTARSAGSTTGSSSTGDSTLGTLFGNRYEIVSILGQGGMGRVYKARDRELDRLIALKTIRLDTVEGPEEVARFKQELLLASKVTHKNVVRIFDLGEAEGIKFFTMEYIEGESLKAAIRRRGRLPVGEARRSRARSWASSRRPTRKESCTGTSSPRT